MREELGKGLSDALRENEDAALHFLHAVGHWWIEAAVALRGEQATVTYFSNVCLRVAPYEPTTPFRTSIQ